MKKVITAIIVSTILAYPAIAGTNTGIVPRDSDGCPVSLMSLNREKNV